MTKNLWKPQFLSKDLQLLSRNRQYQGHFVLDELTLKFKNFNGEWIGPVVREQISRAHAAAVLLYDPKQDNVVLVEQLRIGCIEDKTISSPWLLELVAGLISLGDESEETARREAKEEAGVDIQQLAPICEYYNTPGAFTEKTWIYCALVDSTKLGGIFGLEDEHENIRVHVLSFESIFSQLTQNQLITSASTVIALQWLKLNRASLKQN